MTAYQDSQTRKEWWMWALAIGLAALAWAFFVQQIVLGRDVATRPAPDIVVWAILVLVGVGLPTLVALLRLTVEVDDQELRCTYRPFFTRRIPLDSIQRVEARTYRPILEYGGWGIRWWPRHGWAYTLAGNQGVQLHFDDGRKLLIGTDRPAELARAIDERRRA